MNFRLLFSVLLRFKRLVALGLLLAIGLAFLSYVKVGSHGLQYRQEEKWSSSARMLVTNPPGSQDPVVLAQIYAALATSDGVTSAAIKRHGIVGALVGESGYLNRTSTALPTISVTAISTTPARSATLANDAVSALRSFIAQQQAATGVPLSHRARLRDLNHAIPFRAQIFTPRSKTPPVIVFVLVMAATIGLVLILENMRPMPPRAVPVEFESAPPNLDARRARDNR